MEKIKTYKNGLRLIVKEMTGLFTVSAGIIVHTGSVNETAQTNGLSHFIEHMLFKGTSKRSAFEISDGIDRLGSQINAFTAKEITCYYVKSTTEHFRESAEILSDLFFNSVFDEEESRKEKGVVKEEINMCEDTPEDICLDLLAQSHFGKEGLGQTILGSAENVDSFTKDDIKKYMATYYVPENIVIAIAGNISFKEAEKIVDEYFADNFSSFGKPETFVNTKILTDNLMRNKDIEQAHLGLCMPSYKLGSDKTSALSILNTVFGGGMSSRLFQIIREQNGLAYSVYSYVSQYKHLGTFEIYAGVNPTKRDMAVECILDEIKKLKKDGITEAEFIRGKEQVKSAFVMSQESTASQMLLYGKQLLFLDKVFDFNQKIKEINECTIKDITDTIEESFDLSLLSCSYVGKKKRKLII